MRAATTEEIAGVWDARWGVPIITPAARYRPGDVEGLALVEGDLAGLVTFCARGSVAEIVTLDAWPTGGGRGARLLEAAEAALAGRGVDLVRLVTTNDNPRALAFYVRRGYRLVRLHLDAMRRVRTEKPSVPVLGDEGVPLLDLWELEKRLGAPSSRGEARGEDRRLVSSGSPFEPEIGFSRAVRAGGLVSVSGTAPIGEDGRTAGGDDLYLQTRRCAEIALRALEEAGASLADVVRTRLFLTDIGRWREAARAHAEAFGAARPACTFVGVAALIDPEWLVELEVDAVIAPAPGAAPPPLLER
jgi:enamine deaminase RidA (YjgF/YER057c/UK114 family)/GNAT superfamily N-acetyltransferase